MPIKVSRNRQRLRLLIPPILSPLSIDHISHNNDLSSDKRRFSNSTALSDLHVLGSLIKCKRYKISPNFI